MKQVKYFLILCIIFLLIGNAFAEVFDNFDTNFTADPTWTMEDGLWDIQGAVKYEGTNALQATNGDVAHQLSTDLNYIGSPSSESTISGWVYVITTGDPNGKQMIRLSANYDSYTNNSIAIYCNTANPCQPEIMIYEETVNTDVSFPNTLAINNWYKYEFIFSDSNDDVFNIYDSTDTLVNQIAHDINWSASDLNKIILRAERENIYYDLIETDFSSIGRANFGYTINVPTGIDFNSTSTPPDGNIASKWVWTVDSVFQSFDENFVFSPVTEYTDYNGCLNVAWNDYDTNSYYCETINSGKFYGDTNFYFFDEDTGLATSVTIDFNGTSYTGNSFYLPARQITNESDTSDTYTFTITKADYGTRYYTVDLNQYTDLNVGFLMLADQNGDDIEFQIYKPDQETLYTNVYVEMFNNNKSLNYIGRRKTNATTAKATFFINPNDENYTMRIFDANGAIIDYNAMALTINKPRSESTGNPIDGNWDVAVGGLAWQDYNNIETTQTVQIYANTADDYSLLIGDTLANYYDRRYYTSYLGGTTAASLQPYLVDINDAVSTTVYTISGYTQQPVGSITIKVYKKISGLGRVLVEQVVTDSKGEALMSFIANDEYEFELFDSDGVRIGNSFYRVTSTSTTIYISVDDLSITTPTLSSGYVDVIFRPSRSGLISNDTNLYQAINILDNDLGITFGSARIVITNSDVNGEWDNDVNIYTKTILVTTNTIVLDTTLKTIDGNTYDTNGALTIHVWVYTNQGTYYEFYVYKPPADFDFFQTIGFDVRPFFGCSTTYDPLIPCPIMLFIALFISLLITVGFSLEAGFTSQEGVVGLFLVIMGIFTYLAWVPIGLMGLLAVSAIVLMMAIGGRNRL